MLFHLYCPDCTKPFLLSLSVWMMCMYVIVTDKRDCYKTLHLQGSLEHQNQASLFQRIQQVWRDPNNWRLLCMTVTSFHRLGGHSTLKSSANDCHRVQRLIVLCVVLCDWQSDMR